MTIAQSLKVRDAELSDLATIQELYVASKAYWGYDDEFMNKFKNQCDITINHIQNYSFKLFSNSEQFIGFYAFAIHEHKPISLSLEKFFIHPNSIGKGIGKIMWQHFVNFAKTIGKYAFTLESDPNAINFYKKMGCVQIGTGESSIIKNRAIPILIYNIDLVK
jgi:GNAT superfamily N-acetyltransferase